MSCVNITTYASGPCGICGQQANPAHLVDVGHESIHDIQLRCADCCETHKPAKPKEWPTDGPKTLTGEQGGLF